MLYKTSFLQDGMVPSSLNIILHTDIVYYVKEIIDKLQNMWRLQYALIRRCV